MAKALHASEEETLDIEREFILSNDGLLAWFEGYSYIRDEGRKVRHPEANVLQQRVARVVTYCLDKEIPIRLIMLKPRQRGCSTISVAANYWLLRRQAMNGTIIGGEYEHSDNLWKILQLYHQKDSFRWPNPGGIIKETYARWENDSYLDKETARDAEAGRSDTLQSVIATECARWKETGAAAASEVITGILNCIPDLPYTFACLESTAKGDFGMFYDYWQDAIEIEDHMRGAIPANWNGYFRVFAGWWEFPESFDQVTKAQAQRIMRTLNDHEREMVSAYGLEAGHIAWYRRIMRAKCKRDPIIMMREQPSTPEEAFFAASNRRFNTAGLSVLEDEARQAVRTDGALLPTTADPATRRWQFIPTEEQHATVWMFEPPQVGFRYIVPVDIARGRAESESADPDHHCAMVLRDGYYHPDRGWQRPAIAAVTVKPYRCDIDLLADTVEGLSDLYGRCTVVPESNNDRGLILLLKQRGVNLYQRYHDDEQPAGSRTPRPTGKYGFETTGGKAENTRSWIIELLARAIREWDLPGDGVDVRDLETILELKRFVVDKLTGRAEAAAGEHDDRVITLAIGLACMRSATTYAMEVAVPEVPRDVRLTEERWGGPPASQFS